MTPENGTARTFYRIPHWDEEYELAQSRPLRYLRWLAAPIRIGTSDYAELLNEPDGMAFYGLWRAITELSASCQPRGTLLKEGGYPHTQKSIALTLRCSEDFLQTAIKAFLHLGWLQELPFTKDNLKHLGDFQHVAKGTIQNAKDSLQNHTNNARARDRTGQDRKDPPIVPPNGGTAPESTPNGKRYRGRRMVSRTEELAQAIYADHKKRHPEKLRNDSSEQATSTD